MNTSVVNIKTDNTVKNQAKDIASELGLTLSGVINGYLKQFIRTKTVYFTLNEDNPSDYLLSSIKEAKEDKKNKKTYTFKNTKEVLNFLDD